LGVRMAESHNPTSLAIPEYSQLTNVRFGSKAAMSVAEGGLRAATM
jgi:hypothetical protein